MDNLSQLKAMYFDEYYRFNYLLERYLLEEISRGRHSFNMTEYVDSAMGNRHICFAIHSGQPFYAQFNVSPPKTVYIAELKSRSYAREYGETEEIRAAKIAFNDEKLRDIFMLFLKRNDLKLLCEGPFVIVSWEHWSQEKINV